MVTPEEIRALAQTLPHSYEVFVHGQIKFRVGQIVWLALSKDGERMGRFNWIHVRLEAIDAGEIRDLVEEAWSRAVPRYVAEEYGRTQGCG